MSSLQKFFLWLLPASWAQAMEAESKQWMMRCPLCDFQISIWEAGGIRYKATGNPLVFGKCLACRKMVWMRVEKNPPSLS